MKWLSILFLVVLCASCTRRQFEITEEGDFTRIPLFFLSCSDTPLLKTEIEGMSISLKVDLGMNCDLTLRERILDAIQNKECKGQSELYNVKGTQYMPSLYWIPKIKIGKIHVENALSSSETMQMVAGSKIGHWSQREIGEQFSQIDGKIGTGILSLLHCYFDLSHKTLYLAQNLAEIRKCYSLDDFIGVPFELQNGLVILTAETDFGVKRFILDTGASVSALKKSQITSKKKDWIKLNLSLEGFDFGKLEFFLYDMTDRLPADGILGIDFFKKHGVHLDFEHRKVYIQKVLH